MKLAFLIFIFSILNLVQLQDTDEEVKILSCKRDLKCTPDEIDIYKLCITEVRE